MHIEHIAIWVRDVEAACRFYTRHFQAEASPRFDDPRYGYAGYFLDFDGGARLELMSMPGIAEPRTRAPQQSLGLIHLAFSLGSAQAVEEKTEQLRQEGCQILEEPHLTADLYYESCVLDPEGNRLELTI